VSVIALAGRLTSSANDTSFISELDGFAFIAKAELCTHEIVKAIGKRGGTMNPLTDQSTQQLWFLQNLAVIRARSDQTNGGYAVVEITGAPGDTPPLHLHHNDDEGFYVLEGALRLHAAGEPTVHVAAGEFALTPRGTPHVYVVESEQPARWLALSNGGFDRFVEEVSVPASEATLPTEPHMPPPEELTVIAARHGIEILGPPGTMPEQP
jgi:quercetin dioxygenase-like cupin family protein